MSAAAGTRASTSKKEDSDEGDSGGGGGGQLCHIYAQIHEFSTPSNVVVCRGEVHRGQRLVYTSESNVVRVQLTPAADNVAFFLIKFEGAQRLFVNVNVLKKTYLALLYGTNYC